MDMIDEFLEKVDALKQLGRVSCKHCKKKKYLSDRNTMV